MVFEPRKQSMAWMEHGLQISLKRYALSVEDKMAAGAFGRARNYGRGGPSDHVHSARTQLDTYLNLEILS